MTSITAAGMVTAYGAVLPQIALGTGIIRNIPVNIMKLPDKLETRFILGMNVLQEFSITINNYDGLVTLIPKPLPKKYYQDNYSVTLASVDDSEYQVDMKTD